MSTFSQIACLLLCVCTAVTAGDVSTITTTPSSHGGKSGPGRLQRIEQMLISLQQTRHSPYSAFGYGSAVELLRLKHDVLVTKTKLMAAEAKLEAKLEAMGKNLEAAETTLEATETKLKAKLEATETKLEATETKLEATETKLEAKLETMGKNLEATETKLKAKLEATETKLEATESKLEATEAELRSTRAMFRSNMKSGSTFVRWGRKTCTNQTQLVYSGVAGGSHYKHYGAAANLLCLTMTPQFKPISRPSYYANLYGAAYRYIPNLHNQDIPCSVCHVPQSATIMIPATRSCPTGWTTQYTGHLVAGHPASEAATEYVCLDGDPEDMQNSHGSYSGKLLYYTITSCGTLPCPPYSNNKVVLCVVCSK